MLALISANAGLAYFDFKYDPEKYQSLSDFSHLSFCQTDEKILRLEESMSNFKRSFKAGLDYAVEIGAFSGL